MKRKCNGGTEKVRDEKLKSLVEDEAKCRHLLDLFKVRPTPTKETVAEEQLPMSIGYIPKKVNAMSTANIQ